MRSRVRFDELTLAGVLAALLVVAGGVVHLREWNHTYRHLPSSYPGVWVVRTGFPIDFVASVLAGLALVAVVLMASPVLVRLTVAAVAALQASAVAALLVSHNGKLFGWNESSWTTASKESLALECAAFAVLAAVGFLSTARTHRLAPADAT